MAVNGSPSESIAVHGSLWVIAVHGSSPWQPLAVHCTPSMLFHGYPMQSMAVSSSRWQSMAVSSLKNNILLLLVNKKVRIRTALHGGAWRSTAVHGGL